MIRAAIAFFILALVAFIFGANGIAGLSIEIGRVLLGVFLVLAAISFVAAMVSGRRPTQLP
jgi:uncharacterized membrane protein YtjA (UPF0391 family)